jgi:ABC-type lipoprotein export system ATPase subunit
VFQLERISLHEWYLFEAEDIEIRGATAVLGATGAGKSALLDAIQTVITGNNRNVLQLNYSAGTARDRTVESYCLGRVSDFNRGEPRRDRSETIVALTFRSNLTGFQVSAGLLLAADVTESGGVETKARFVIRGHGFKVKDFLITNAAGEEFIPKHDDLILRMKEKFGKAISFYLNSKTFTAEYLHAMRPRNTPSPERFWRSFAVALSAKEIKDPTDFVRRFVLEPKPLDIQGVRQSIRTWRELQQEVQRIETKLQAAKTVRQRFMTWAGHRINHTTMSFQAAHADRQLAELDIRDAKREMAAHEEKRVRMLAEAEDYEASIKRLRDLNERDAAHAASSDEAIRRRALQDQLTATKTEINALKTPFERAVRAYTQALRLRLLADFLPASARPAVEAASDLQAMIAKDAPVDWAVHGTEIRIAADRIRRAAGDRAREALEAQHGEAWRRAQELKARSALLDTQIAAAGPSGPFLSKETLAFRDVLAKRGISAVALPDLVDVSDPSWAFALEALLGPHREALIVSAEQVQQAFDILYYNRGQFDGCRLINTRKTRGMQPRVAPNSIAEIAITDDPDAQAFIASHVGRYQRAENEFDLDRLENGVLRNGKMASGTALRVFRDRAPILGRTAQAAILDAAKRERGAIHAELSAPGGLEERLRLLQAGTQTIDLIAAAPSPEDLERDARTLEDARLRAAKLVEDIRISGDMDSSGLTAEIMDRRRRIEDMEEEAKKARLEADRSSRDAAKAESRSIEAERKSLILLKIELDLAESQRQDREVRLIALAGTKETIDLARNSLRNTIAQDWQGREKEGLARIRDDASRSAEEAKRMAEPAQRRAGNEWNSFLTDHLKQNPLPADSDHIDPLFWVDVYAKRLEEHELLPHRTALVTARAEMENMLKEDLLTKIHDLLESARLQLEGLNRRLKDKRFVGQIYSFDKWMSDRLKPLADLAKVVAGNPELDYGSLQKANLAVDARRALDQIEVIVGSEDDTREIEDYRNYFEFDLQITGEDGQQASFSKVVGTLSGGQRQAPYYVAIAASMVSAYFPSGKLTDSEGLSLVVFDEAFDKLDVRTTKALLDLFRHLGLQVLVAAPEVHRPTFVENVDTVVSILRQPSTDALFVRTAQPGPAAKEAMGQANPEHIGVEGYRAKLAEAAQQQTLPPAA